MQEPEASMHVSSHESPLIMDSESDFFKNIQEMEAFCGQVSD